MMTIYLEEPMKRLFALLTVIAASAVLFSCGGGSSDDDSAKLSGESLTITKAAGAAVDSAVNAAMDSIKTTSAKKVSALKAVSPESIEVNYSNADKSLVVSGTQAAMDVTMKDYVSESDGHKLVLNGTIKVTLTFAEGIITMLKNGTINLTYDGAAHVVIMDYTTVTNEEKGTYSITGTVTFDGTASKYEESGSKEDGNKLSAEAQIAIYCAQAAISDLFMKIQQGSTFQTVNVTQNDVEPAPYGFTKTTFKADLTAYAFSGIVYPGDKSTHSGTFTGSISYTTNPNGTIMTKVQIYNATALVIDGKSHTFSYEYEGSVSSDTQEQTRIKSTGKIDGQSF